MKTILRILFLFAILSHLGCEEAKNTLIVSKDKIEISAEGGTTSFTIKTDALSWSIENPAEDWLNLSAKTGTQKEATILITVNSKTLLPRLDTLTITAGNAIPVVLVVKQESSEYLYELKTNRIYAEFSSYSGSVSMTVTSSAPEWKLTTSADWITLIPNKGTTGTTNVTISVVSNIGTNDRTDSIKLSAEYAPVTIIPVIQKGLYPNYNTNPVEPDITGMTSTAVELAAKIKIGWNIGNTLEAMGGETAWGNPMVTSELIQLVKQKGFNAIRIPCSWNQYVENNASAKIKTSWLNRVKQVVQYCVDNDMYVLLNIHWDGGWLENNVTTAKQEEVNARQKAFWEQIATHLRDFDEHLIFASANEPNVENATQMAILNTFHQTFVDAVRSTGGRNSYRVLVVQGPSTDIDKTNKLMNTLPTDKVENRMMVEIHYYTPYQFCLMTEDASWGKMFYYWGKDYHSTTDLTRNATWGEETTLDNLMKQMKTKFVDKGIPVILGEYAVIRRTTLTGEALNLHLASRAYFLKYMTKQAKANGLLPFYWDAGNMGNNASALFNRRNYTVYDQQALDAIMQGAE